ncbi:MAG: hypothetical protein ACTSPG_03720 [Candidatus Hodarchaeales archaeon]
MIHKQKQVKNSQTNLKVFQHTKGFIANSSGAAFFQFYILRTKKNLSTEEFLSNIGIKPNSIAHFLVEKMGVLRYILNTKQTKKSSEDILEGDVEILDGAQIDKNIGYIPNLDFSCNDYYLAWIGMSSEDGFIPYESENIDRTSLGFLYLMKISDKESMEFIKDKIFYASY